MIIFKRFKMYLSILKLLLYLRYCKINIYFHLVVRNLEYMIMELT